jgi:tyrosine-protein kinase Etk/Wzc
MKDKSFNVISLISVIVKWRRLIVINVFLVGVVAVVISLLLPKWYEAKAIILPPHTKGNMMFGMGGIGEIASSFLTPGGFELPMLATRSDVYSTILESQRVSYAIIREFKLDSLYKAKNIDVAVKKLKSHRMVEVGRDGCVHVSFEAKNDPQLAANVTNAFLEELNKINMETSQQSAGSTREFIGQRLAETDSSLAHAEEALRDFQEQNKTISIEDQTKATIEGSATLVAEMMAAKIRLGVLSRTYGPTHQEVMELDTKIKQIGKVLDEMNTGNKEASNLSGGAGTEYLLPLKKLPDLALEYGRLFREFKIQEILYELLIQQYEQAKIQEKEDTPTVQVMQYAEPPVQKSRPKRALIVLISVALAFFISLLFAYLLDYYSRAKASNSEEYHSLRFVFSELKKDLRILPFVK